MTAGTDGSTTAPAAAGPPAWLTALPQLALAVYAVHLFAIENPAFERVFQLAAAGFVVHALLPRAWRLPCFVALSLAGAFLVFRPIDALWLFGTGLVLIAIANLPASGLVRGSLLAALGLGLAVARAGAAPVPWSATVWPILGSMFMFRLVLYSMAVPTDAKDRRGWWSLAYFFMLPNLVFPLYPVVDYQTFRRTYFDKDEREIYGLGLLWIARGIVHLVLYRYVYQNLVIDPEAVVTLGDLAQFMLATLLLYLRVSGQFHLIVGVLHLFGFRLPETHKLYLLANSFTELWRRINLYWTDFMMKTVFYPTYFRVKDRGPRTALVLSSVAVFVVTWLLHSYQWFWLRGGFPITPQDTAFWGILGAFVVYGGLKELGAAKGPRRVAGQTGWNATRGLQTGLTFSLWYLLWSLWSTESLNTWLWTLGAIARPDIKGLVLVFGAFLLIAGLGGYDWKAVGTRSSMAWLSAPAVRTMTPLVLLCLAAQAPVRAALPPAFERVVHSMQASGLNARDLALQHRGYYEQLDVRAQLDTPVSADGRKRDASWQTLDQLGLLLERQDLMLRELRPSRRTTWNGHVFTTNSRGMRDQEYAVTKPAGTFRVAITGPSHVMGNNVGDGDVFEHVVEERLNRDFTLAGYDRFEILNFGVDGYSLPQQVALLEDRVFQYSPDVVIATHYKDNRDMTEGLLLKIQDQAIPVPQPHLHGLLQEAGLLEHAERGVPLPYPSVRQLVGAIGLPARMPHGEAKARARHVADDVLAASFEHFAQVVRAHGSRPAVLALNVVFDDAPDTIPLRATLDRLALPVFDLFHVYPADRLPALRVAPWDDHPNAEGHRIVADALYRELTTFLATAAPTRQAH